MNIEVWENEGGYMQKTHQYFDSMGFEETHEGSAHDCAIKGCVRERKYYSSIPSIDPGPDVPDPWMFNRYAE